MNENRIQYSSDLKNEISIKAFFDTQKQSMLVLWMVLWSLAGIGIISQFFFPMQEGLMIYLVVWLAFWIYFEYKVIYAFRWRKFGAEWISINNEYLIIENRINGRGMPQQFEISWIKNVRLTERRENSFIQAMNEAYWNISQESLMFEYKGKVVYFGRELNSMECEFVLDFIRKNSSAD